jgi:hypothetical protein
MIKNTNTKHKINLCTNSSFLFVVVTMEFFGEKKTYFYNNNKNYSTLLQHLYIPNKLEKKYSLKRRIEKTEKN